MSADPRTAPPTAPAAWARSSLRGLPQDEAYRGTVQAALDGVAWVLAVVATTRRPVSLSVDYVAWGHVALLAAAAAVVAVVVGLVVGLYAARWQCGSFEEVTALVPTVFVTGALLLGFDQALLGHIVPVGSLVAAPAFAMILMGGSRYVWRLRTDRRQRPDDATAERVLVFGAGRAGRSVVASMLASPDCRYLPVAFLDDDPRMHRRRIKGLVVEGDRRVLREAAARHSATTLLLAVSSAPSSVVRQLSDLADEAGLSMVVLPGVNELVAGQVHVDDIRRVTPADLLGRTVIRTDVRGISGYVAGRRVLVTGAGGSIGSELCRQLSGYEPSTLVMLDRDESSLHGVQLSIEGSALLDSPNLVVADIRDRDRLAEVFRLHRPEVVFHAAALKHLPLLEMHPAEAVKTNVWGTQALLELAVAFDVGTFVNISTDKAADPTSVLGTSKRLAERLTAAAAVGTGRHFVSVRFGNVVGSRGSVLLTFQAQVAAGGPVTVTDPAVTRYFMTIEEAVQLVIQAGALGERGEVLVLDMGEPVSIADLARRLVRDSHRDIDVVFTGLRPGEKLHERLVGSDEVVHRSRHPLILQTTAPPLPARVVRDIDLAADGLPARLAALCRWPAPLDGLEPTEVPQATVVSLP